MPLLGVNRAMDFSFAPFPAQNLELLAHCEKLSEGKSPGNSAELRCGKGKFTLRTCQGVLTDTKAREIYDLVTAVVGFDSTTRTIIDGRRNGLCKLIVGRPAAD
jgi:hypothetical protein